MLIDKEVCQNPEIENQTARFVEQKFDVNVDDVLIRPLDMHSAQLHIVLYQNLTLKEAHKRYQQKITLLYQKGLL